MSSLGPVYIPMKLILLIGYKHALALISPMWEKLAS